MSAPDLALTMPLNGLQLIEASAGTGKTFTLAGLHLRLVVEQRRAVREILAVTFTDAATQELKTRLRARLAACAALLEGETPAASDDAETRQAKTLIAAALINETREQLVRRLRLAALDVDHAPVSTIHGFCRRALDEFGLLAGRSLSGELIASDRDLIDTACADYWRSRATAADAADFFALQTAFKTPETLAKILAPLVSGMRRLLPAPSGNDRAMSLLHDALDHVRARVAAAKRAAGRHSHDDEIRELHDALTGANGAQLAQRLHERFPVALIDEFQDTDALQFTIFDAIYGHRGDLILIGDPKQAIYGFRGGDVHTYLRARGRVADVQTLARNFRSSPAYLRALNTLYAQAGDRAFAQAGIEYQRLEPGDTAADDDLTIDGKPAQPLTFWRADNDALSRGSKEKAGPQLAAACASGIFDLLAPGRAQWCEKKRDAPSVHRPLQPADIAVLVATHDEALDIQHALAERGIASASITRRSVFAGDEAAELHSLLDALADFDEARLRGAMTTRLLGATASDLATFVAEPHRWSAQLEHFAELRRVWSTRGVAAMLALVFEHHASALLHSPRGERRMTNWLQLAELAQTASGECVGLRGLVDWLAARIAHADHENEDEQLRLESDAGRVKIYTLHKSKGLQFPVVFLPFTGLRRGASNQYPRECRYRDDNGQATTWIAVDKEAAESPPAIAAKQAAARDDLAERLRILYVALTRACGATFVAADPIGSGECPALLHLLGVEDGGGARKSKDALGGIDAQLAQRLSAVCAASADTIAVAPLPAAATTRLAAIGDTEPRHRARTMPHAVRDDWRIASYSRLVAGARDEARADRNDEGAAEAVVAAPSSAGLGGARFGTAFHELIEVADFAAWRDWRGRGAPPGQDTLIDRVVRRHALGTDSQAAGAVLADLLARTLNAPLPLGARLADLAPGTYRAEMPFHFALGQVDTSRWLALLHEHGYVSARRRFDLTRLAGLMTGVLDLVVLHDRRWWVIDYKTNFLGFAADDGAPNPYAPSALAAAVRDSEYDLQYLIYLTALHRWLASRDPRYDYARDIGGALYLFVRGLDADGVNGVHVDAPPVALIAAIDAMLGPQPGATA